MPSAVALIAFLAISAGEPNWSNDDYRYQALEFTAFRTSPDTWSPDGAYGLRWGMGPGDVALVFPALRAVFSDTLVLEGQSGFVTETLNGLSVSVSFAFLRGRLYEIHVSPGSARATSSNRDLSVESLERYWDEAWKWRRALVALFERSLGKPVCAPSDFTVLRYCANVAPLPGCGPRDIKAIERLFRWVWRSGRTETLVIGGPSPELNYTDITAWAAVERSRRRARAAHQEREAREKEAEFRKITGGSPAAGGAFDGVVAVSNYGDEVAEELKPLECFRDEEELTVEAATSPSSWSRIGVGRFRWGMGPGDVKEVLPPEKAATVVWDPGGLTAASMYVPEDRAFGANVSTRFLFPKGRLWEVSYSRECSEGLRAAPASCVDWFRSVQSGVDRKYGKSRCTRDGKYSSCQWDGGLTEWPSLTRYDGGSFQAVHVSYRDPGDRPNKLDPTALRAGTPSSTWSKQGWFGFMWGMGVGDVRRRLVAKGGEFNPSREIACVQDDKEGRVECVLERDFHAFSVAGLQPSLTFGFRDNRLYQVSLIFPKHLERDEFVTGAKKLTELLVARYGKPESGGSAGQEDPPTSMGWDLEGQRVSYYARIGNETNLFVIYTSMKASAAKDVAIERSKL